MNKIWILTPIIAASLLFIPSVSNAATSATFTYSLNSGGESTSSALLKEGTTYVSASHWEAAGLQVSWDKLHRRAQFVGWGKSITVSIGSREGVLDGKWVDIGGTPFQFQEQLYVPARFLVKSLGGETVSWDSARSVFKAKGILSYASASAKFGGLTYSVDKKLGKLYVTDPSGKTHLMANLGSELYDIVNFDFKKSPAGLIYLTLSDIYGEPHINNKWHTLVIKNGMVIRQASVGYHIRFGDNVKMYDNTLLLTDGKTLRLIEDGTGNVTETIDLTKLGGEIDKYLVEGMDDDFLLIRPNQKGILMLIDRKTGAKTLLYKKLLNTEQQEYAETNDIPFYGDNLKFLKREGDSLLFKNEYVRDGTIYRFPLNSEG